MDSTTEQTIEAAISNTNSNGGVRDAGNNGTPSPRQVKPALSEELLGVSIRERPGMIRRTDSFQKISTICAQRSTCCCRYRHNSAGRICRWLKCAGSNAGWLITRRPLHLP
jgi:hypothetical protein